MGLNQLYLLSMILATVSGSFFILKGLGRNTSNTLSVILSGASGMPFRHNKKINKEKKDTLRLFFGIVLLFFGLGMIVTYLFLFTTDGYYGML